MAFLNRSQKRIHEENSWPTITNRIKFLNTIYYIVHIHTRSISFRKSREIFLEEQDEYLNIMHSLVQSLCAKVCTRKKRKRILDHCND